ncbi:MAG TPA: DUF6807 family protein [Humisphaera sp.]
MNRRRLLKTLLSASLAVLASRPALAADDAKGFAFKDAAGDHLDVTLDGKVVARYMYAHDTSTKERAAETYKPYLHVFDAEGTAPITKGAGGDFTHHRGIFIGWNKITYDGKAYDRWHMKGGDIVHQKFAGQKADADAATFTSVTGWQADGPDKLILTEERTTTIRRAPAGAGRVVIDFTSKLTPTAADLTLDGDPEHAGIHFRPAQEIVRQETAYVYPKEKAEPHKDKDYPWVGENFTVRGKRYGVVEFSHPSNPAGTRWSAYRDYGRFGAFPKAEVKKGESLTVKYRFLIADGEVPAADVVQKIYDDFAGATAPSPVPQVTRKPAEGAEKTPGGAKKPAATKPAAKPPAEKPAAGK